MISVVTISMGREKYVMDLIDSIMVNNDVTDRDYFEHIILFNGTSPSDQLKTFFQELKNQNYPLKTIESEDTLSIGMGLNLLRQHIHKDSTIVMKADDDCVIRSDRFFTHVYEVMNKLGQAVISPYPVGLINNPGGVPSREHSVIHSEETDVYYTLRRVNHIGGFARIVPADIFRDFEFPDDKTDGTSSGWEDGDHSKRMTSRGVPMYYLENALIVEHNESTLGQHERYGDNYFGERF